MIWRSAARKCDPGAMHRPCKCSRFIRVCALEHRRTGPVRKIIEHERDFETVAGLESSRRLPVELIQKGRVALVSAPLGHAQTAHPEARLRHQLAEQRCIAV